MEEVEKSVDKAASMSLVEFPLYKGYLAVLLVDKVVRVENYDFNTNGKDFRVNYAHTFEVGVTIRNKVYECYLIALNFGNDHAKVTHGIIAHEAMHVTRMLLESRGVRLSNRSDEAYAYMMTWIVDEIYELLRASDYVIVPEKY